MATARPTLDQVRNWLKLSPDLNEEIAIVLDAEISSQNRVCRIPDPATRPPDDTFPGDLYAALLRRCSRAWAARKAALGLVGGGEEYGPQVLSTFDAEIERYERPWRKVVV